MKRIILAAFLCLSLFCSNAFADYVLILVPMETIKPYVTQRLTTEQEKIDIFNHYLFLAKRRALVDFVRAWDINGTWEEVIKYNGVMLHKGPDAYMGWCLDRTRILSDISQEVAKTKALGIDAIGAITADPLKWLKNNGYTIDAIGE